MTAKRALGVLLLCLLPCASLGLPVWFVDREYDRHPLVFFIGTYDYMNQQYWERYPWKEIEALKVAWLLAAMAAAPILAVRNYRGRVFLLTAVTTWGFAFIRYGGPYSVEFLLVFVIAALAWMACLVGLSRIMADEDAGRRDEPRIAFMKLLPEIIKSSRPSALFKNTTFTWRQVTGLAPCCLFICASLVVPLWLMNRNFETSAPITWGPELGKKLYWQEFPIGHFKTIIALWGVGLIVAAAILPTRRYRLHFLSVIATPPMAIWLVYRTSLEGPAHLAFALSLVAWSLLYTVVAGAPAASDQPADDRAAP